MYYNSWSYLSWFPEQQFPPQTFSEYPQESMLGLLGSTKALTCRTSSFPPAQYRWLKNDVYFTEPSYIYYHRFTNLSRSDEGEYRCEARNSIGALLSQSAHVGVSCKSLLHKNVTIAMTSDSCGGLNVVHQLLCKVKTDKYLTLFYKSLTILYMTNAWMKRMGAS